MQTNSRDEYLNPVADETIDYRADRGSEDRRTPNSEVPRKWEEWQKQSDERELKYFIPDWADLVDPRYDFEKERYSNSNGSNDRGSGGWENEVFAHQFYDTPSYDGILVSREVLQKSKKKKRALEELADGNGGIHRYLRVPPDFPVMGDCGAFGYVDQEEPPYSVDDVLDYYTRHGFNYGISVDHLVFGAKDEDGRQYRYDLTLRNAQEFYSKHQAQGREWTPMAAVQGWNVNSYVEAAKQCADMGYDYLAIGGLVRSSTEEILLVLRKIREAVGPDVDLHALGVARFDMINEFVDIGVTSMDSATYLRRAWTSRKDNFWTRDEIKFSAIRVPGPKRSLRNSARKTAQTEAKKEIERKEAKTGKSLSEEEKETHLEEAVDTAIGKAFNEKLETARVMEQRCFYELRAYDKEDPDALTVPELVDLLDQYQEYVGRECLRNHYAAMLEARPWDACDCTICERAGIEVAIFRGNNRNRRRGFHNTRVFYDLLQQTLKTGNSVEIQRGADIVKVEYEGARVSEPHTQYHMFE
jgi:hypothetical protein